VRSQPHPTIEGTGEPCKGVRAHTLLVQTVHPKRFTMGALHQGQGCTPNREMVLRANTLKMLLIPIGQDKQYGGGKKRGKETLLKKSSKVKHG